MSERYQPGMATVPAIMRALAVTYTPDGVASWLASPNDNLCGCAPYDLLNTPEGRERVAHAVIAIDGYNPHDEQFNS